MAHDTIAPWAEAVPDAPPSMTSADLLRLPDDARGYELVEGRLVRMPPTGWEHSEVTSELHVAMRTYAKTHQLGSVVTGEPGFLISQPGEPETVLAPDIAFVRAERLPAPGSPERRGFLPLVPDMVVEVVSPSQYAPEVAEKAQRWLAAGVRLVWVIWPNSRHVDVWQPGSDTPVKTLGVADTLSGQDVAPGFELAVARLFP
jgi:Uma2 family endonuclease